MNTSTKKRQPLNSLKTKRKVPIKTSTSNTESTRVQAPNRFITVSEESKRLLYSAIYGRDLASLKIRLPPSQMITAKNAETSAKVSKSFFPASNLALLTRVPLLPLDIADDASESKSTRPTENYSNSFSYQKICQSFQSENTHKDQYELPEDAMTHKDQYELSEDAITHKDQYELPEDAMTHKHQYELPEGAMTHKDLYELSEDAITHKDQYELSEDAIIVLESSPIFDNQDNSAEFSSDCQRVDVTNSNDATTVSLPKDSTTEIVKKSNDDFFDESYSFDTEMDEFDKLCDEIDARITGNRTTDQLSCPICGLRLNHGSSIQDLEEHTAGCCPIDDIIIIDD